MSGDFCIKCDRELSVDRGPCVDAVRSELDARVADYQELGERLDKAWTERDEAEREAIEHKEGYFKLRVALLRTERERDEARAEVERLRGIRPELPPRPPDGDGLPRYGLRWNGPTEPVAVPMADGYWTPWHLAVEKREPGCQCQWEAGDSPCRVHGEEEP